jgi:hypothetical protein
LEAYFKEPGTYDKLDANTECVPSLCQPLSGHCRKSRDGDHATLSVGFKENTSDQSHGQGNAFGPDWIDNDHRQDY